MLNELQASSEALDSKQNPFAIRFYRTFFTYRTRSGTRAIQTRRAQRVAVAGFWIVCLLTLTLNSLAQTTEDNSATKNPQAASVLSASLAAMGGQAFFASIQDSTVSGQMQSIDTQQPPDQFVWKTMGMAIRHEYSMADGLYVSIVNQGQGQSKDPSGSITPLNARSSMTILPYHMPGILLLFLLTSQNISLTIVNQPSSDPQFIHVSAVQQLQDSTKNYLTAQEWEFDPATSLPVKVTFYLPDVQNQVHDDNASVAYTSWQRTSDALFPQTLQLFTDADLQSQCTLQTPVLNQGLNPSDFQLQ